MLGLLTSCHALPSNVAVDLFPSQLQLPKDSCTDRRPPPEGRAFVSPAVENSLQKLSRQMSLDPDKFAALMGAFGGGPPQAGRSSSSESDSTRE